MLKRFLFREKTLKLKQNRLLFILMLFLEIIFVRSLFSSAVTPIELNYSNGLTVEYYKINNLSYSKIIVKINSGDSDYKSIYGGITELTLNSILKGCEGYSEESVKKFFLINGVFVEKSFNSEGAIIKFSLPTENLPRFLKMVTSCLSNPYLYSKAIEAEKKDLIKELLQEKKEIIPLLKRNIGFFVFGKRHPYGKIYSSGNIISFPDKRVKEFYKTYFVPSNIKIIILSSLRKEKIKNSIFLSGWERKPVFRIIIPKINKKIDNVFVKTSDNRTAYIILTGILPGSFKTDRYKINFFAHLINGYFGSRANIFFSGKGINSPDTYLMILNEYSIFSLIFHIDKKDTKRAIDLINKFIAETNKTFPTDIELKDGITSFIGKKFLQWQRLDQYYLDYLFYYKNEKLRKFGLKNILLKLKKSELKKLYGNFKNSSILIIAGNDYVRNQLKGFYRVYYLDDF